MTVTNNNQRIIHRKEWQMMTPAPVTTAAAMHVASDPIGKFRYALYNTSASVHHLYDIQEDAFAQIPASGIAGAYAAGSCSCFHYLGLSGTASAGTTTTLTTTHTIIGNIIGAKVRITSGTRAGEESYVTGFIPGANSVITVSPAFGGAIDNTSVYQIFSGKFYFFNAGTAAVGFRSFDIATMTWSGALTAPGAPITAFATDGALVSTCCEFTPTPFATGTATSGSTTTLVNSAKNWATDQWINSRVRITAGTGIGKSAVITDSNATTLTFANIGATIDDTSEYVIEGDDNALYLLGNGAAAIYKYSISAGTWATLTPSPARGGNPSTGFTANWIFAVNDTKWNTENSIRNGRYIYSFRGGAGALLDVYDIALNGWINLPYGGQMETFTTGSSAEAYGNYYYIRKDGVNRFFKYDFANNFLTGFNTNTYTDGAGLLGDKVWIAVNSGGELLWLYSLMNTGTALHRILIF